MSTSIRRGLWLLPLAGVLTSLPWFEFVHVSPGQEHVGRQEALRAISLADQLAVGADAAGFLCLLFGLLALTTCVMSRRGGLVPVGAVVVDVLAVVLLLSVEIGVLMLARPVAADFYISGHGDTGALVLQFSGGSFGPRILSFLLATIVVAAVGAIATGAAIWRSRVLPRWTAVLLPLGFALAMTDFPFIGWIGSALLLGVGGWIALRLNRAEIAPAEDVRAERAGERLAKA